MSFVCHIDRKLTNKRFTRIILKVSIYTINLTHLETKVIYLVRKLYKILVQTLNSISNSNTSKQIIINLSNLSTFSSLHNNTQHLLTIYLNL